MVTIHEVTPRFMRRDSLALQLMLQQHRRVAMHINGWSLAARRWNRRHRAATDSHRSGHGLLQVLSQSGYRLVEGSGDFRPAVIETATAPRRPHRVVSHFTPVARYTPTAITARSETTAATTPGHLDASSGSPWSARRVVTWRCCTRPSRSRNAAAATRTKPMTRAAPQLVADTPCA